MSLASHVCDRAVTRRCMLQTGGIGFFGLSLANLAACKLPAAEESGHPKSVIFIRTPKISHIAREIYKYPGRDHWAPCQSVLFAGGGVRGGTVIGASDRNGAYPISDPQTPENFAATIYNALGIPRDALWHDLTGRPNHVYLADPIQGLMG